MTRQGFADVIELSVSGGGFGKLVGAMAAYSLIETGRKQIFTTELCEKILYGTRGQQSDALEKSVRSVSIFAEIYDKYGRDPSEDQLRNFLHEKGGVDIAKSKAISAEVGKIFRNNSVYLRSAKLDEGSRSVTAEELSGEVVAKLEMADYGILNIRDEISMDLAIKLLARVKKVKGWSKSDEPVLPDEAPRKGAEVPPGQTGHSYRRKNALQERVRRVPAERPDA